MDKWIFSENKQNRVKGLCLGFSWCLKKMESLLWHALRAVGNLALSYLSSLLSTCCPTNVHLSIHTSVLHLCTPAPTSMPFPHYLSSVSAILSWSHVRILWSSKIPRRVLMSNHSWELLVFVQLKGHLVAGIWDIGSHCYSQCVILTKRHYMSRPGLPLTSSSLSVLLDTSLLWNPAVPQVLHTSLGNWYISPLVHKLFFTSALFFIYSDPQMQGIYKNIKDHRQFGASFHKLIQNGSESKVPPCWLTRKVLW